MTDRVLQGPWGQSSVPKPKDGGEKSPADLLSHADASSALLGLLDMQPEQGTKTDRPFNLK